jgi:hypothetical protein
VGTDLGPDFENRRERKYLLHYEEIVNDVAYRLGGDQILI